MTTTQISMKQIQAITYK